VEQYQQIPELFHSGEDGMGMILTMVRRESVSDGTSQYLGNMQDMVFPSCDMTQV